jgi:hypothetical protein
MHICIRICMECTMRGVISIALGFRFRVYGLRATSVMQGHLGHNLVPKLGRIGRAPRLTHDSIHRE